MYSRLCFSSNADEAEERIHSASEQSPEAAPNTDGKTKLGSGLDSWWSESILALAAAQTSLSKENLPDMKQRRVPSQQQVQETS